ncbi:MAG: hypothetical protein LW629_12255 [Burkholderiales bacterium]|nr:hypothetical protein [Burkholderiales bacterium]
MYKFFRGFKRDQLGLSLVEISIWLMLAGVVLGNSVLAFEAASRRAEVNSNAEIISNLVQDARFMYGRTGKIQELSTTEAIESGLIPARLTQTIDGGAQAFNSYGGEIVIESYPEENYALIRFGGVPSSHCVGLVTAVESLMAAIAVTRTDSRPSADSEFNVKFEPSRPSLDVAALGVVCEQSSLVYLQFKFYKE